MGLYSVLAGQRPYPATGRYYAAGRKASRPRLLHAPHLHLALHSHSHGILLMLIFRKAYAALISILFIVSACAPPTPIDRAVATPRPNETQNVPATETPTPAGSSLNVDPEALRGIQVNVWHPWFGAEASLFQSQIAQFNTENEWGILVSGQSQGNYSELFLQTDSAIEDSSYPQVVIGFPEHALEWQEHVVDLTPYVNDPLYGWSSADVADFPAVIWEQDEADSKRLGIPAQRTARFLLYNQS